MRTLRLGLAQINTTVGDLEGNQRRILKGITQAKQLGVDLVAFPEMTIPGYPPEDLLLRPSFINANLRILKDILPRCRGITAIVGFADRDNDLRNAAAVICDGRLVGVVHKTYLPNYGVFDENRYFQPSTEYKIFTHHALSIGISICEDIWSADGSVKAQALWGDAQLLINISGSPYAQGKGIERERMLATRAIDHVAVVAMCNLVGGQDELVFDGHSLIIDESGKILARAKQFEEDFLMADIDLDRVLQKRLRDPRRRKEKARLADDPQQNRIQRVELPALRNVSKKSRKKHHARASDAVTPRVEPTLGAVPEIYQALVLATRDYLCKNGFKRALVGISGGIDSALVSCIAVDALGPDNVTGIFLPSQFTSCESREDAQALAHHLGIELISIPIDDVYRESLRVLKPCFKHEKPSLAEENLQARIRANLWMALSNQFGWLVLTTGNKSELSVGYSTLYGDMAGGFCVLKDIYKTGVYPLAAYRNSIAPVIPRRVLQKAPTAELRTHQTDEADLPAPYRDLDQILEMYVEHDRSVEEMVRAGFKGQEAMVRQVVALVDKNEYKRRQAPVGPRITARAFGRDRRMPIVNHFREC
jgi:NAD+ synthase (glutamine-hydrolysing)